MTRKRKTVKISGVTAEEYAAYWVCDPTYDKPPREPGDGYLFYNFGCEAEVRDKEFLTKFLAAIDRTLKDVNGLQDAEDLRALKDHVASLKPESQK